MGKQEAFEEMCKKKRGSDGKYTFSFNEIADIVERHMKKPKKEVLSLLTEIGKEQKQEVSVNPTQE